jgi:hypothetical protein
MLPLDDTQKFEALKLRYEDQVVLLRTLTEIDHRLVTAFFTLQLALGGWLATSEKLLAHLQIGITVLDLGIAAIFLVLLSHNHKRRQEVASTIENINDALGFEKKDKYLVGKSINPKHERRYWLPWYIVGVVLSTLGLLLVIYRPDAASIALSCESTEAQTFRLEFEVGGASATLVQGQEVVLGRVGATADRYSFVFPASDQRWETHLEIHRRSGAMKWEHGKEPFMNSAEGNVSRVGRCTKADPSLPL